jgi:hypothetical protein
MAASRIAVRSKEKLAQALKTYSAHRPLVQRVLNVTFIVYILSSTYTGLSGHSSRSGKERPKKDKGYGATVKPERVAVCIHPQIAFLLLKHLQGRHFILPTIIIDSAHCDTWDTFKRGFASFHTFKLARLQDGNIALRSRT